MYCMSIYHTSKKINDDLKCKKKNNQKEIPLYLLRCIAVVKPYLEGVYRETSPVSLRSCLI